tara:strand:- start:17731 stop:18201 length:471 start_codon:yes stop_codon:yes gene_type:complete
MHIFQPSPDPNVLFYTRVRDNGVEEIATISNISIRGMDIWEALFLIPGQAPETINQSNSALRNWEPIYAVTTDINGELIERIAQRVVEILNEEDGIEAGDLVESAMGILDEETVAEAVGAAMEKTTKHFTCDECDKSYIYEKALYSHKQRIHAVAV